MRPRAHRLCALLSTRRIDSQERIRSGACTRYRVGVEHGYRPRERAWTRLLSLKVEEAEGGHEMLKEPTLEKLHALRLRTMAAAWEEQQKNPDAVAMSFDERLALLVDAEWMARENDRVGRALKERQAPHRRRRHRGHRLLARAR